MQVLRATLFSVSPRAFWNWGRLVLGGAFALSLLLIVFFTWTAPQYALVVPVLLAAAALAWVLFQHPLLNLGVVLAGFVTVAHYNEGISLVEAVYGVYALGFLAHWFATRFFLYRDRVLDTPAARALFLFLVGATLIIPLSILLGARPANIMGEWIALAFLGFYFPIREACARYRHGTAVVVVLLGWVGLYVSIRNGLDYRAGLSSAKYLFQIVKGRVITNDALLLAASLLGIVFLVYAERWRDRALLLGGFLAAFAGLILTQSRAGWVAFLFGTGILFVLARPVHRKRLALYGLVGIAAILGAGFFFLGNALWLILAGLFERAATLGQGAGQDISFMSRFVEAEGALARLRESPLLGMGLGVSYQFFDIISQTTVERHFIHNGYVGLLYRFGVWGFGLVMFFWFASIWHAFKAFRWSTLPSVPRVSALAALLCLVCFLLTAFTSNPFFLKDTTLLFGIITGIAGGVEARQRHAPSTGRSSAGGHD